MQPRNWIVGLGRTWWAHTSMAEMGEIGKGFFWNSNSAAFGIACRRKLLEIQEGSVATNRVEFPRTNNAATGLTATLEFSYMDFNRGLAVFRLRPADNSNPSVIEVPLSQIVPNTFEDQTGLWEELVKALFNAFRTNGLLPSFVRGFEVQRGEDSTGDPALYVTILVTPTPGPADDATVAKRSDFASSVHDALLQLHLQRYPYVRLGERRRRR